MRLYHFTEAKNLVGISIRGLAPQPCGPLTMGQEVVWLSTQETLRPTQADLDWGAVHLEEPERYREQMILGCDTRLTVHLSTASKRLVHYHTWLRTTKLVGISDDPDAPLCVGNDLLKLATPSSHKWWIYFGTIPPKKIELDLTPATALPGIKHNLADALESGEAHRIAKLTQLLGKIEALPRDAPINFVAG